ncbi:MAG: ABC transporter ATP-binding protein [Flavobacteriaceae bacterium]|nr:ABC transporter ATP-binding protein [Flavobacteriaceae bacterium]CAI8327121.1 MAG: Fe(3+) ions import ATP-binding protein FbpC 2 [Flavobacteriaceae bacterium]|tara:strand:- start:4998 stop:5957 length:960 start_codon:yes stop_codon:yes gene_type:complete
MHLKVSNLVKFYNKRQPLIESLDFSVEKGEIVSFLGESGVGKTTFLKCISGLEDINSGSIILNNKTLNDKDVFVRPQDRKIGFVFQDYPLFPHLNLKDNIVFNLDKKYLSNLDYMLSLTNLTDLVDRFPHELSGGEQQRACIARALIREPDLLLLDEPFSNLDVAIKHSIRDEIYRIIKATKTTTILVTHDINDSLNIADKILVFKAGKLQQYDDPVEMYCKPANCYCARILGGINKLTKDDKPYYIRPEKIKIEKTSKLKLIVEKSLFQGKEYNITAKYEDEVWNLFSSTAYKKNDVIYVSFNDEDLIYFPPNCLNYF